MSARDDEKRDDAKIGEEMADHLIAETKKLLVHAVMAHGPDILLPIFCKAASGYLAMKLTAGRADEGLERLRGGLEAARLDAEELMRRLKEDKACPIHGPLHQAQAQAQAQAQSEKVH